jgi:hypothetical protein
MWLANTSRYRWESLFSTSTLLMVEFLNNINPKNAFT